MQRLRLSLILSASAATLFLFQNCARVSPQDAAALTSASDATGEGQLKVSHDVALEQNDPTLQNTMTVDRLVNPQSLDFGPIAEDFTYHWPYHLDIAGRSVTSTVTKAILLKLDDQDMAELQALFQNAIVANRLDYLPRDILCADILIQGYANLVTDQGSVILGSGTSTCSVIDLYKDDGSGQTVDLRSWLLNLTGRLPPE